MVITDDRVEQEVAGELLLKAQAGDAQAFCLLIEPHQTRLLRQAAALSRDLCEAEDLVSETLIEAWKSLARYDGTCRLSTWLYSILLHRYHKAVRRSRSRPISLAWLPFLRGQTLRDEHQKLPATELSPADAISQKDTNAQLRRCIEALPHKQGEVLMLRFFEEASLSGIAKLLGCSIGTVKSRLHHALEKLRKMKMNLPPIGGDT